MAERVTAARRRGSAPAGPARPGPRGPAARRAQLRALRAVHRDIRALRLPGLVGTPVHGPPVASRIFLLGQAPGPHEARLGRPFAWTAGRTLFRWFERACGASEREVRERVYLAAVVRAFPGKTRGGGDRVPGPAEIAASRGFIERELAALEPRLVIPVGRLAIEQVLGPLPLAEAVGRRLRARYHGVPCDVVCLPHPSGASTWFKTEPGRGLLERALRILARHPEVRRAFPPRAGRARPLTPTRRGVR
ncbi:MAG TPA: uracil-DNA glycosylase family protein [Anaeromyxobacteraceae bacterium]|nr:uracil-DNA glycosylase family protein [Anaeromyxobacteraceae bacterium]